MKTYLGWDCAYKSLAWTHLTINTEIYNEIIKCADVIMQITGLSAADMGNRQRIRRAITSDKESEVLKPEFVNAIKIANMKIGSFMKIHDIGVSDILDGRLVSSTTEMERTRALFDFLSKSRVNAGQIRDTKPIIEHQPPKLGFGAKTKINNKSTAVAYQLAFHYIEHDPVFIDPKLKNNIALREDLTYDRFFELAKMRYRNVEDAKYHARKDHSRENFLFLLSTFGLSHVVMNIPKSLLDDVADSTMQIFAYLRKNAWDIKAGLT